MAVRLPLSGGVTAEVGTDILHQCALSSAPGSCRPIESRKTGKDDAETAEGLLEKRKEVAALPRVWRFAGSSGEVVTTSAGAQDTAWRRCSQSCTSSFEQSRGTAGASVAQDPRLGSLAKTTAGVYSRMGEVCPSWAKTPGEDSRPGRA